ncbi:hypothetical protein V6N13_039657 [Hibiscus sabdariffa]
MPKSNIINEKGQNVVNPNRAKISRVKDSRTYKEALLNKTRPSSEEVINGNKEGTSEACGRGLIIGGENLAPMSIVINEADTEWLKKCLIGQVSAMYDQDFVQQILQSEGFRVKVSCWIGFYSIIRFEEEEQLEIFWELRDTMLKQWFSDIDTVGNFMESKKLSVWACIQGIPIEVWNESVLVSIGSQWGEVIRLDPDTAERNRLDTAKILIGVKCLSVIPPFASIEVNGVFHKLKIAIAEYDDDRCWIDSKQLNSQVEIHSNSDYNRPGDPCGGDQIGEDFKVMENDATLKPLQDNCDTRGDWLTRAEFSFARKMRSEGKPYQEQNVGDPSKVGYANISRPNKREVSPVVGGPSPNGLVDLLSYCGKLTT